MSPLATASEVTGACRPGSSLANGWAQDPLVPTTLGILITPSPNFQHNPGRVCGVAGRGIIPAAAFIARSGRNRPNAVIERSIALSQGADIPSHLAEVGIAPIPVLQPQRLTSRMRKC